MYLSRAGFGKGRATLINPRTFMQLSRMSFAAKEYDVAVIGGGPGGYVAAIKAG